MITTLKHELNNRPLIADFFYAIILGLLSLVFGELNFVIPGLEGGLQSDFKEIPLLIALFYTL